MRINAIQRNKRHGFADVSVFLPVGGSSANFDTLCC